MCRAIVSKCGAMAALPISIISSRRSENVVHDVREIGRNQQVGRVTHETSTRDPVIRDAERVQNNRRDAGRGLLRRAKKLTVQQLGGRPCHSSG